MKKPYKLLSLLLVMAVFMAGCGTSDPSINPSVETEPAGSVPDLSAAQSEQETASDMIEELHVGITKDIEPRSMASESGSFGRMNYNAFCAGTWLTRDVNNDMQPNLMTDWEISEDGKTIIATFATDQGITWHDGAPLTIEDIIFTVDYSNNVMKSGYLAKVESVEKLSDTQIQLNLIDASAYYTLGGSAVFVRIFPKHIWEGIENPNDYAGDDAMIGCGPYKVVNVDEEARTMTYEAVGDTYMGRALKVKRVVVHSYESLDSLAMALVRGDVDAMNDYSSPIPPTMLPAISNAESLDVGKSINLGLYQILFGFNRQPTDDVAFRVATRTALDYELLAVTIGGEDGQVPGPGVITPNSIGYDDSLPRLEQNLEEGNSILEAAGYKDVDGDGVREMPDGSPLEVLITPQFNPVRAAVNLRIAEVLIDNLGEIGVRAVLDEESARNQDHELTISKGGSYQIYINFSTQGVAFYKTAYLYVFDDPLSAWGTCNLPEFVDAYNELLTAHGPEEYIQSVKQLQQINAKQAMNVSLCWDTAYYPYRTDKFTGWINYPGWGVINRETWYLLERK